MNKIFTLIALILLAFSSKAQETIIVRGYLERPNARVSINLQKNMFCYLKGDFIMPDFNRFCTFKVDSVISGSIQNFSNEINKPPFNIMVGLINECIILDFEQQYTLKIKQFQHTNYYYIDSLSQVYPNEKYSDKLSEYHKNYQQNINILTKGTLQERRDFLDEIRIYDYTSQYQDYRYIPYIIPYMTSKDSIVNDMYISWDGVDENGNGIGGTDRYEESGLYSDYLYNYLANLLPFNLPDKKTTDSIGWHKWYDGFFPQKECYPSAVKYTQSQHKTVANKMSLYQFIPFNRKIHIGTWEKSFSWNMDTEILSEKQLSKNCYPQGIRPDYSIQKNEIAFLFFNSILHSPLNEDCIQYQRILFDELKYNPGLVAHCGNDFLMFYYNKYDCRDCLKSGKINRKGE